MYFIHVYIYNETSETPYLMHIITSTADIIALCDQLQSSPYIALDTEFMREGTYYAQLSLIQVATDTVEAIIDPLHKDIDISPFFDILRNPNIIKVLHAARQDLEIFHMLMGGYVPAPIFDTQVVAAYVGYGDQVGYETLVHRILQVSINKSARFTDWSKRPLMHKQLEYAIGDVTHLRHVYKKLHQCLVDKNRTDWVTQEMDMLESPDTYAINPTDAYQKIKYGRAKPKFLAVLQQVASVREIQAMHKNLPRRRYIKDETLLDIAGTMPKTHADLSRIRGIPKSWINNHHGNLILQAVKKALALDPSLYPQAIEYIPPTKQQANTIEILKMVLKICANDADIVPRLMVSTQDIEKIARGEKHISDLPPWTYDIFGVYAEKILQGTTAITLKNGEICLTTK